MHVMVLEIILQTQWLMKVKQINMVSNLKACLTAY